MYPNRVAVVEAEGMDRYAAQAAPFHPSESYPELEGVAPVSQTPNVAFEAMRNLFRVSGFDLEHYGTRDWNPLGWLVKPGDRVVLKPNFVVSEHPQGSEALRHTVTDGPVLRAICEYVLIALRGEGRLVIGDSPIKETEFAEVTKAVGADQIVAELGARSTVPVSLVDFRDFVSTRSESAPVAGKEQGGDPDGYAQFDLGTRSALEPVSHLSSRFRSTAGFYENRMSETHGPGVHRYGVSGSVIGADVLINVPKLKTHSKAGITVGMKNAVGICNEKRWLPHHRFGAPSDGGDFYRDGAAIHLRMIEGLKDALMTRPAGRAVYPPLMQLSRAMRVLTGVDPRRVVRDSDPYQNGGWHGNDTVWRMVLDLNRILIYGDMDGKIGEEPAARKRFTIVDGLWGGHGNGPLKPTPIDSGVLLAGSCNVLVDLVCATIMGFDPKGLPTIRESFAATELPLTPHREGDLDLVSDRQKWSTLEEMARNHLGFVPPDGWAGFIDRDPEASSPIPPGTPVHPDGPSQGLSA